MIEVRKLDIVVANGMNSETRIIDIKAVTMKLSEKIRRYQDLALELKWVWSTSVKVTSIGVGALGAQ